MKRTNWRDEDELWLDIVPHLRGSWRKLELSYPAGLCDSVGLWDHQTHWLELKLGRPRVGAFEPLQVQFAYDCQRHNVPYWVCFGHLREAVFFRGIELERAIVPPFVVESKGGRPTPLRSALPSSFAGRRRPTHRRLPTS